MKSTSTHLPSLLGLLLFITGAVILLGISLVLAVLILSSLLTGRDLQDRDAIMLAVTAFEGVLLLAAAFVAIQKLRGQPSADFESSIQINGWQMAACLLVAGAAIGLGQLIVERQPVDWLLLPLLTLPAVILPILVLLGLGTRGLSLGPRWRTWNVLGTSMTLVPFLTFILEGIAILFIVILVLVYIVSRPELMAQVQQFTRQIYLLDETDPEQLIELVAPLLLRPDVMLVVLLLFSVVVPLIEELVKPMGVWLFGGQIRTPAQGFALGALGGAAFAMIETLGVSPQSEDWSILLLTRLGTDVLHVTTSALMGAGIVYAIHQRRYLRFLGTYVLCVLLHGLWNGLAILFTFSTLADLYGQKSPFLGLAVPAGVAVAVFALLLLAGLVVSNRRYASTPPAPLLEEQAP